MLFMMMLMLSFINEEIRPFNFLNEDSYTFGIRHLGNLSLKSDQINYGFDLSNENYQWDTFRDYMSENQSLINHQVEKRKNYNIFVQYDKKLGNRNDISIGLGSNNINYSWKCCDNDEINSLNYKYKPIFSPRISYNYEGNKKSLFINISHGFSSPNINETLDENGLVSFKELMSSAEKSTNKRIVHKVIRNSLSYDSSMMCWFPSTYDSNTW